MNALTKNSKPKSTLNKKIKTFLSHSFIAIAAITLIGASGVANAGHGHGYGKHKRQSYDYARVSDVRPIYQTVTRRVPIENCRVETVRVDHHHGDATLVGGLIGAAIGHNLGHGKKHKGARTVAGAIIGASIANSATRDRRHSEYRDVKRCHTRYDVERYEELVGYNVTYRYQGRTYRTRTDSHPGKRLRVAVSVRPAH